MSFLTFVLTYFKITLQLWNSKKRKFRSTRRAKEMSAKFLRDYGYSNAEISRELVKARNTVHYWIDNFDKKFANNPSYREEYKKFEKEAYKYIENSKNSTETSKHEPKTDPQRTNPKTPQDKIIADLLKENNKLREELREKESKIQTLKSLYK